MANTEFAVVFASDIDEKRLVVRGGRLRYKDGEADDAPTKPLRVVFEGTLSKLQEYDGKAFIDARKSCKGVGIGDVNELSIKPAAKFDVDDDDAAGLRSCQGALLEALAPGTVLGRTAFDEYGLSAGTIFKLKGKSVKTGEDGGVAAVGLCAMFEDLYWFPTFSATKANGGAIDDFLQYFAQNKASGLHGTFQLEFMTTEWQGKTGVKAFLKQADGLVAPTVVDVRVAPSLPVPKRQKTEGMGGFGSGQ